MAKSRVSFVDSVVKNQVVGSLINHVALVIDGSSSMQSLSGAVVNFADQLVSQLAAKSKETDQETRISLYVFEDRGDIKCHTYDKDVLRMPSLKGLYRTVGMTPLIDATLLSIEDLSKTATLYGDHAFLVYVLTDGGENASKAKALDLQRRVAVCGENWTLACFVPGVNEKKAAETFGFPPANVQIWETSAKGFAEMERTVAKTVNSYYTMRSSGIRGSRNLFSMDLGGLTKTQVVKKLTPLHFGQYRLMEVEKTNLRRGEDGVQISAFIESRLNRPYRLGEGYYQLVKRETVQPQKAVAIYDRKKAELYVGPQAREVLGLPDYDVKVAPEAHPNFDIFIQSTSTNRKLLVGQKLVVIS